VHLTIYALAIARRTSLPLKAFKCGWFDENDYFEFFPLQGVYRRQTRPPRIAPSSLTLHGTSATVEDELK